MSISQNISLEKIWYTNIKFNNNFDLLYDIPIIIYLPFHFASLSLFSFPPINTPQFIPTVYFSQQSITIPTHEGRQGTLKILVSEGHISIFSIVHCVNCREGGKEHLRQREWWTSIPSPDMSLACLVCHSVESPSHSFRSYSVSSSDNEGRCSAIANCLARRASLPAPTANSSIIRSSKVTPHPSIPNSSGIPGTPRLVRSCAVRRDIVRDWNFDEVVMEH
ncbi:unnamed protein product, partial [Vitis vinifera]|uniref:Uncharacterized protein n=1 Tax=Vitis vinifera TaxID=29760 RepID=D7U5V7_VITVI